MIAPATRRFCADEARKEGDPLAGTASVAATWILVERREPWGRRAVEEDPLPATVREWLSEATRAHTPARVAFVRRADRREGPVRVAVARPGAGEGGLWATDLDDLERIVEIDLRGLDTGDGNGPGPSLRPMVLVCGNARRDRCCARRGLPLYEAADRVPGNVEVWLSTHLGGHRYAAVAVALPMGAQYGFLGVEDAEDLVRATENNEILGPHFRGRTFHPPMVQAADRALRTGLGLWAADAVSWVEPDSDLEAGSVAFRSERGRYVVAVREERREALVSCGPDKVREITEFVPLTVREIQPS